MNCVEKTLCVSMSRTLTVMCSFSGLVTPEDIFTEEPDVTPQTENCKNLLNARGSA